MEIHCISTVIINNQIPYCMLRFEENPQLIIIFAAFKYHK